MNDAETARTPRPGSPATLSRALNEMDPRHALPATVTRLLPVERVTALDRHAFNALSDHLTVCFDSDDWLVRESAKRLDVRIKKALKGGGL